MRFDGFVVLRVWRNAESGSSAHEGDALRMCCGGTILARTREHQEDDWADTQQHDDSASKVP